MPFNETTAFILSYFILTGILSAVIFETIRVRSRSELTNEHKGTLWLKRFFYFVCGGALLPLMILIAPAAAIASVVLEKRLNHKNSAVS